MYMYVCICIVLHVAASSLGLEDSLVVLVYQRVVELGAARLERRLPFLFLFLFIIGMCVCVCVCTCICICIGVSEFIPTAVQ